MERRIPPFELANAAKGLPVRIKHDPVNRLVSVRKRRAIDGLVLDDV
jgi:hypothetical protein